MSFKITRVEIRFEQDVVHARQRASQIAELLGFDRNDQTRISTAVSEIARNSLQHAGGGAVEYSVFEKTVPQALSIVITDQGPGIRETPTHQEGQLTGRTASGKGLIAAKRLVDKFQIESRQGAGTTVTLSKTIPTASPMVTAEVIEKIHNALAKALPGSPFEEIRRQNQELSHALEELRKRQEELAMLNQELTDTNRGVMALYAELDEKAVQLAKSHQLEKHFLSNMSHEFRTPLNSILALSRLLLEHVDGDLNEEQEKQTNYIRQAAENLSALVNDLLDLAKIDAGKIVIHPKDCCVDELFSGLRGMLKPLLVTPSLELVFEPTDGIPLLYTDDGKVAQILRNFISNAIKFTEKGEIRVSVRLSQDGSEIVFVVADTGIGIAPEDQERVFNEYAQVERAQKGRHKGTGLGLPISRKLAGLLGGKVWVESRSGVGSVFSLSIPVRFSTPKTHAPVPVSLLDPTHDQILVVEDDAATQFLYSKFFRESGFQILPVTTIRAARQAIDRVRPFAIILDIMIPGEDGWGFLMELKSSHQTRDIPVFVVTVLEEEDKGMSLGADDYCVKPVERSWLLERLQSLAGDRPVEKVLIIDDEEVARYITKGYLLGTRYSVIEASSGDQGLSLAESAQPSVIFLDLMMPGMNGFEVLRRLKENPATREIPVIICSSKALEDAERQTLMAQAHTILSKHAPTREAALENVRKALQQAAALHTKDSGDNP